MNEQKRKERNEQRVTELWPAFSARIKKVIANLEAQGIRPRIQDGYRSPADQLKAFNTGHSKLKYAVYMLDDDHAAQEGPEYLLHLAAAAEANGLTTGVRWGLPAKLAKAIDDAIASKNWKAKVKVGWDPCHVEPVGISPAQAKAGKRPS